MRANRLEIDHHPLMPRSDHRDQRRPVRDAKYAQGASSMGARQSEHPGRLMSDLAPWPRTCGACGREYDARDRRVRGAFHFHVVTARAEPDGSFRLVGHWRSGVWSDRRLVLLRRDGLVPLTDVVLHDLPAEGTTAAAHRRGQAVLMVRAERPDSIQAGGCILEADMA